LLALHFEEFILNTATTAVQNQDFHKFIHGINNSVI